MNKKSGVHAYGVSRFVLILWWAFGDASTIVSDKTKSANAFFMDESNIHIGNIINAELARQKRTKAWLAREINCERTNVYNILKNPDINTVVLMRISKALNRNLFAYYSREFQKKRGKKHL